MNRFGHGRLALILAVAALAGGCAAPVKPLYLWESFPRQQYEVLQRSGASADEQIRSIQAHIEKARASAERLPPGLQAHLGMLHLSAGRDAEARAAWVAEKAAFPESAPYIDQLLKRLESPVKPASAPKEAPKEGNPA